MYDNIPVMIYFEEDDSDEKVKFVVKYGMVKEKIEYFDFAVTKLDEFSEDGILTAIYPKRRRGVSMVANDLHSYLENYDEVMFKRHIEVMSKDNRLSYRYVSNGNNDVIDHLLNNRIDLLIALCIDYPVLVYINQEIRPMSKNWSLLPGITQQTKRVVYSGEHDGESVLLMSPSTISPPDNFIRMNSLPDVLEYIDRRKSESGDYIEELELGPVSSRKDRDEDDDHIHPLPISYVRDVCLTKTSIPSGLAYLYRRKVYPLAEFNEGNFHKDSAIEHFLINFYENGLLEIFPGVLVTFEEAMKNFWMEDVAKERISRYLDTDPRFLNLSEPDKSKLRLNNSGLMCYYNVRRHLSEINDRRNRSGS